MAGIDSSEALLCTNCGAVVGSRIYCPACGAPAAPHLEVPDQSQQDEVRHFIESTDQDLVNAGTRAAESAFGLGCFLGAMVTVVLVVIVFILGSRNWILLGILAMVAIIIAAGAAVGISTRAKSATINKSFQRNTQVDIDRFIQVNHLDRIDFEVLADQVLSKEAPLRKCLGLYDRVETRTDEE
jgi:hypothetical protein